MALTVTTVAPTLRLTTRAAVQAELGISSDGALIDGFIDQYSSAIVSFCHRPFAREAYVEALAAFGDIRLQLARTPVVSVTAVTLYGNVVTDYGVEDADKGWLYVRSLSGTGSAWNRSRWPWSFQSNPGLSAAGAFLDIGSPLPSQEEKSVSVTFTAGYILPSQFLAPTTVSVAAADNSFNDSASGFPSLLKAGDVLETSGFANAANNGRFLVSGTPTTSKIVVTSSLTLETAPIAATAIKFRPPSSHRPFDDVEKACIEAVKSGYASRKDDSGVIEKQAGPMRLRYSDLPGPPQGLPPSCIGLLRPWVRTA